jgi:hypothetical protein
MMDSSDSGGAGRFCLVCRAVEAAAGGEHVRVRGRARDVGDAEPHHRAGAPAPAQPVPAPAAAVGRQVPPLPGILGPGRRDASSSAPLLCALLLEFFLASLDFSSSSLLVSGACTYQSTSLDGL